MYVGSAFRRTVLQAARPYSDSLEVGERVPPSPPPPQVSLDDLRNVNVGMDRVALLNLGAPASRITMFDDGHLVEIYRYMTKDTTFGVVRLSDGAVSIIQLYN